MNFYFDFINNLFNFSAVRPIKNREANLWLGKANYDTP